MDPNQNLNKSLADKITGLQGRLQKVTENATRISTSRGAMTNSIKSILAQIGRIKEAISKLIDAKKNVMKHFQVLKHLKKIMI